MRVAEAVGRALAGLGVDHVFGVVGSGNFHVTNALVAAGARFVAAGTRAARRRMADAYARVSGRSGVLTVHQGRGLTNALTGITEAAKSRTPLLVLAAGGDRRRAVELLDRPGRRWPPRSARCPSGCTRPGPRWTTRRAAYRRPRGRAARPWCSTCRWTCRPQELAGELPAPAVAVPAAPRPSAGAAERRWPTLLAAARRPVFIAGRGAAARRARAARGARRPHAARCWPRRRSAKGLFAGDPWYLDVSGGFASPLAAELIARRRPDRRLGLHAEHVDHSARPADRPGRHGGPGRPRPGRARRSTTPSTSACVGDVAEAAARGAPAAGAGRARPAAARRRWPGGIAAEGPLAGRAVRGRVRRRADRPAHADASRSTTCCRPSGRGRRRLRQLHGLPERCSCPCRTRPASASPRRSSRSGSGWPARSAPRWPGRTGSPVAALGDGGFLMARGRAGHRGPARPADGDRGLQRRRVRRRGAPLRPGRPPAGHGRSSRTPTSPRSAAASAAPG